MCIFGRLTKRNLAYCDVIVDENTLRSSVETQQEVLYAVDRDVKRSFVVSSLSNFAFALRVLRKTLVDSYVKFITDIPLKNSQTLLYLEKYCRGKNYIEINKTIYRKNTQHTHRHTHR